MYQLYIATAVITICLIPNWNNKRIIRWYDILFSFGIITLFFFGIKRNNFETFECNQVCPSPNLLIGLFEYTYLSDCNLHYNLLFFLHVVFLG